MYIRCYMTDTAPLADPERFDRFWDLVPRKRQEKIERMKFPKDRNLSLAAGLLLEYGLEQWERDMTAEQKLPAECEIDAAGGRTERPDGIIEGFGGGSLPVPLQVLDLTAYSGPSRIRGEAEISPEGKPYLRDFSVHYNLSHSGTRALCVISDLPAGCDIQRIGKPDLRIPQRYFAPAEYEYLLSCTDERQTEEFFRLWTLKESFMKCTGRGFYLALDAFSIRTEGDKISVTQSVDDGQYHFLEYDCGSDYKAAVCVRM